MQRIYYAGDHFLTGTEIADALVSYAAALAQQGTAGAIEIPVRHEDDGRSGTVHFLVGPASQIMTEEVKTRDDDEVRDDELVKRLRALTAELAPMHPMTNQTPIDRDGSLGYDWTDEV